MEKIKEPKQKMLFLISFISNTQSFKDYFIAKNIQEAEKKAKIVYPRMGISNTLLFSIIND